MLGEFMRNSMKLTKFAHSLFKNLLINPGQLKQKLLQIQNRKRSSNGGGSCSTPAECEPKNPCPAACIRQYNTPHPPKDPPENFVPCVVHQGFEGPDGLPYAVFRPFDSPSDVLGPGAHKCSSYKNAEYYAYHRYSFAEMQRCTLSIRQEGIRNDGARLLYDYDSSTEDDHSDGKANSSSSSSEESGSDRECSK